MNTDEQASEQIAKGDIVFDDELQSYRIKGYVPHAVNRGLPGRLDCALITHVVDGLYQGGCIQGVSLPGKFDYVLSLYPWERYNLADNTSRKEVKMYDSLDQATEQVDELAEDVARRVTDGQMVLVHCQAGLNRSGLLAGRALMFMGYTADDAIALLRKRSPLVLCNDTFENWLRSL